MSAAISIRSDAQREASRINGAQSQGPCTEEGKERSSQNATKHGLRSPRVVLSNEDPTKYQKLLAGYVAEWKPLGITESDLLVRMVNARWRSARIETILTGTIDNEMFIQKPAMDTSFDPITAGMRQADSVCALSITSPGTLEYYGREHDRLERLFERCKRQLSELQTRRGKKSDELDLQPVCLLETTEESASEPDLIGNNYDGEENFWWISTFVPTPRRPNVARPTWPNPAHGHPQDKAA